MNAQRIIYNIFVNLRLRQKIINGRREPSTLQKETHIAIANREGQEANGSEPRQNSHNCRET